MRCQQANAIPVSADYSEGQCAAGLVGDVCAVESVDSAQANLAGAECISVPEVGTKLAEGLAASGLLLAVPCQDGGLEDTSLVAHLLVQWDVTCFDACHDVRAGDADQISRFLGGEYRVRCRF